MGKQESVAPDDGDLEAPSGLTKLEEAFCEAFSLLESPSYGKVTESAAAAGFQAARNAGWRVMRRPRVRARITQLQQGARAATEKVLSDLEHTRLASMEKGDLATAARCSQLQGQALGLFYERNLLTVEPSREYDERAAVDARRITTFLLMTPPDPALLPEAPAVASAAPAGLLQDAPAGRATAEEIERAQAPRTRQGE